MAVQIRVRNRLSVHVDGDTYPTVILGLEMKDSTNPEDVYELVQTAAFTEACIATRPYGLVVVPNGAATTSMTFVCKNVVTGEEITMATTLLSQIILGYVINPAA